jgi:hypothetical protein
LKKRHLNVPLQLDSDEFITRANPIENMGHFSKEQNRTKMVSNVCQNPKRKTKWNKFAEMRWNGWMMEISHQLTLLFSVRCCCRPCSFFVMCTTEKEMIRWASKTKRCKRSYLIVKG